MTGDQIEKRVEAALTRHNQGYNCAQAVSCAFADQTDYDERTLFRMTEGLGLGTGNMEGTCGAIAAAAVLAGLANGTGNLEHPDSKKMTYRAARACMDRFREQNTTVICRQLKGKDTGKVIRSCDDCIADAVRIAGELLFDE